MSYALNGQTPKNIGIDNWIAPSADLIGAVTLLNDASIWWKAVLRADNDPIDIGARSNIQDGCVLHTDPGFPIVIGANVSVGHMCMLHGCSIGDMSLIGIGSIILNGARIGQNCLVGANTLVTEGKEIPDNSLVMGSPGKVIREVSSEQIEMIEKNAQSYVDRWRRYRSELTEV
ncbi:MAG: gamma carbonic anhydrase family protein [Rhodospirillaceae bacterium]|jgi:carbonic anhydrase/acetyltransferase-like protein (isoleucine patch superfamily)